MDTCGETIIGKCMYCMKYTNLQRTYFRFNLDCECHSPKHFEIVEHCGSCTPKRPSYTSVLLKKNLVNKSYFQNNSIDVKVYLKDLKVDTSCKSPTLSSEIRLWIPTHIISNDQDFNSWEFIKESDENDNE